MVAGTSDPSPQMHLSTGQPARAAMSAKPVCMEIWNRFVPKNTVNNGELRPQLVIRDGTLALGRERRKELCSKEMIADDTAIDRHALQTARISPRRPLRGGVAALRRATKIDSS